MHLRKAAVDRKLRPRSPPNVVQKAKADKQKDDLHKRLAADSKTPTGGRKARKRGLTVD